MDFFHVCSRFIRYCAAVTGLVLCLLFIPNRLAAQEAALTDAYAIIIIMPPPLPTPPPLPPTASIVGVTSESSQSRGAAFLNGEIGRVGEVLDFPTAGTWVVGEMADISGDSRRERLFTPWAASEDEALALFLAPPVLARLDADVGVLNTNLRHAISGRLLGRSHIKRMRASMVRVRTTLTVLLGAIAIDRCSAVTEEFDRTLALAVVNRLVGDLEYLVGWLDAAERNIHAW